MVLWSLIKESGYKVKAKDFFSFQKQVLMNRSQIQDLDEYLDILHQIDKVQSFPIAIKQSVYDSFISAYLNGCTYQELRFNATKRSQKGTVDLDAIIVSARAGMEKARIHFGIDGDLALCMGRDCTEAANTAVFKKALQYHRKGVKTLDLAGPYTYSEDQKKLFPKLFQEAKKAGLQLTVHAAELDHDDLEWELKWLVEDLKPDRIGHGVHLCKFPSLLKKASNIGIHLEVCITSNLMTRAVSSKKEFKQIFQTFADYGIDYSINTDATYLLKTDIAKEHQLFEEIKRL